MTPSGPTCDTHTLEAADLRLQKVYSLGTPCSWEAILINVGTTNVSDISHACLRCSTYLSLACPLGISSLQALSETMLNKFEKHHNKDTIMFYIDKRSVWMRLYLRLCMRVHVCSSVDDFVCVQLHAWHCMLISVLFCVCVCVLCTYVQYSMYARQFMTSYASACRMLTTVLYATCITTNRMFECTSVSNLPTKVWRGPEFVRYWKRGPGSKKVGSHWNTAQILKYMTC